MNDFLNKQISKKVDKFCEGKSDAFIVLVTQWLIYGGLESGMARGLTDSDLVEIKECLISQSTIDNLVYDMTEGKDAFFCRTSAAEKSYLATLSQMLHYECFSRLRKSLNNPKATKEVKKVASGTKVFTFTKGLHWLDEVNEVLRPLVAVTRKPATKEDKEKYALHDSDLGDMSDYEIFEKQVKITVEIEK